MEETRIAIADDHRLFREGIARIIANWGAPYKLVLEAINGSDLIAKLEDSKLPDMIIMDVNMPVMDGFTATEKISQTYPQIRVLALTMLDNDIVFERLVKSGIHGFLRKNTAPAELKRAIDMLMDSGLYFDQEQMTKMIRILRKESEGLEGVASLSPREVEFLRLACSEKTYAEVAEEMHLSEKTIDGYRARVFEKLGVKSRVGMVLKAVKEGVVDL